MQSICLAITSGRLEPIQRKCTEKGTIQKSEAMEMTGEATAMSGTAVSL